MRNGSTHGYQHGLYKGDVMKLNDLIAGILLLFLAAAMVTGQCLCASSTELALHITEHVIPAEGEQVQQARRTNPIGYLIVERGDTVVVVMDCSYTDEAPLVKVDDQVITDGHYAWGTYWDGEGANVTFSDIETSHTLEITYYEWSNLT